MRDYLKEEDIPQRLDCQLDVHLSNADINGAFGGNRCLRGNEYIYTPKGVKLVEDIHVGNKILGGKVLNVQSFESEIYEVYFSNGERFVATSQHPLYWKKYPGKTGSFEWKTIADIIEYEPYDPKQNNNKGFVQFVPAKSFNLVQKPIKWAKLLGYLCSDGYISRNQSIKFTNTNESFCNEVEELSKEFGIKPKWYKKGNGFDLLLTLDKGTRNPVRKYLDSLSITQNSFGEILSGNSDSLKEFLRSFFNGDGYLIIRKRKKVYSDFASKNDYPEIGFCTGISYQHAREMQYILWKLDISSFVVAEFPSGAKRLSYRVKVSAKDTKRCLEILDWQKYPDKFKKANKLLSLDIKRHNSHGCVSIQRITKSPNPVKVYGWKTSTNEIISYSGIRTHNSGKTTCGAIEAFIWTTAQLPNSLKDIYPKEKIPAQFPQHIRVETVDYATLNDVILPTYQEWVPRDYLIDRSWGKSYSAEHRTLKLGKKNELFGTIQFMTNQQDVESHQGATKHGLVYDEEPDLDIHKENLMRFATAERLKILFTMTPTKGMSWVYSDIFLKAEDESGHDIQCFKIPSITNKKVNLKVLREILDKQDTYSEIKMRLLGEFISLSGFVYGALFNRSVHVIPSFFAELSKKEKADYIVYRGLDPHLTTPTACVELAVDREENAYVVGCYTGSGDTEEVKADLMQRAKEKNYRLGWTMCDKSADSNIKILGDKNIFLLLSRGENAIPALFTSEKYHGSIHAGVDEIKKVLKVDPKTEKPKLVIEDIPENKTLINAMRTLERDRAQNEERKGERDKIAEGKHHFHAALRYIYQRPVRWIGAEETVPIYIPDSEAVGY